MVGKGTDFGIGRFLTDHRLLSLFWEQALIVRLEVLVGKWNYLNWNLNFFEEGREIEFFVISFLRPNNCKHWTPAHTLAHRMVSHNICWTHNACTQFSKAGSPCTLCAYCHLGNFQWRSWLKEMFQKFVLTSKKKKIPVIGKLQNPSLPQHNSTILYFIS